jgi:hypothetical protein
MKYMQTDDRKYRPAHSILQRYVLLGIIFILVSDTIVGQDYLPSSGGTLSNNLKINGTDAAWSENLLLIKPSGWGGVRFSRRDPAYTNNFDGNWAIGYTASTGNDLSISSNYQGTQYDYLLHISAATRNIGIGFNNPLYKLHVNGTIASNQVLGGNNVRSDGGIGGIDFFNNGIGYAYSAKIYTFRSFATNEYYGFTNDYDGNGAQLSIISKNDYVSGNIGFYTGSGQRSMSISSQGNVGIGTSIPSNKLVVNVTNDDRVVLNQTSLNNYGYEWAYNGQREWDLYSSPNNYLQFYNQNLGAILTMQTNSGNVGIGTTNPSEKLSVNGNIRSRKVIVTQNGWADYVFNDGYRLRPLTQVESYIKENKHLPEIPTAKEVEKNGVDLGETQALLLKKIEELTLYMIEMKKESEKAKIQLQKENSALKQRIEKLENKR